MTINNHGHVASVFRAFANALGRPRQAFFFGTFAPAARASDRPIAIACLRLVTFFFERPERSVPALRSCITLATFLEAPVPYFLLVFFLAAMFVRGRVARLVPKGGRAKRLFIARKKAAISASR